MRQAALLLLVGALAAGFLVPAAGEEKRPGPPCTCIAAQAINGWCDLHGIGYVASIPIRWRMVYDTLDAHGHQVDLTTFDCPSCRKAIQAEGFCEEHGIGFVNRLAYFSRLTYELARAVYVDPAGIECPLCRNNASTAGWCREHGVGMVGGFAIRDEQAWQRAAAAADRLRIVVKKAPQCERCAVAILYDSDCPVHNIYYKDGVPVPPPPAPKTSPE